MPTARTVVRLLLFPGLFACAAISLGDPAEERILLGSGEHTYEWVRDWARLPDGMELGNTHGCVVVDSTDRVYLNTDTENAVVVFESDGTFLGSWGKELARGLHGMCLVREDGREVLWLAHIGRHEVLEATLEGEILARIAWPEESGLYPQEKRYRPTSVVPAPGGELFVADGYGKSFIHRFTRAGEYLGSFGGRGTELGELHTPHGLMLDVRSAKPELLVADRENGRLQRFGLDGEALGVVEGMLRRPCHVQARGSDLVIADLAGRVTILDGENELVVHLGDNPDPAKRARNDIARDEVLDGEFVSPHCAAWDSEGNLYVTDWLAFGRITKLRRVR